MPWVPLRKQGRGSLLNFRAEGIKGSQWVWKVHGVTPDDLAQSSACEAQGLVYAGIYLFKREAVEASAGLQTGCPASPQSQLHGLGRKVHTDYLCFRSGAGTSKLASSWKSLGTLWS